MCKRCLWLLFLLVVVGCGPLKKPDHSQVDESVSTVEQAARERVAQFKSEERPAVTLHNTSYYGAKRVAFVTPQPDYLNRQVVLVSAPLTLSELLDKLTQVIQRPVSFSYGLQNGDAKSSGTVQREMPVLYEGTLRNFLDAIAGFYGISWECERDGVHFYKYKTKTFSLVSAIGKLSIKNTITNKSTSNIADDNVSSASGSDSEGVQSTEMTSTFSVWEECQASVKAMLSPDGIVVMNRAAGTIVVTDVPSSLEMVETYVADMNQRLSRQVALSVHIYSLKISSEHDRGFSVAAVFNALNSELSLSMLNAAPFASDSAVGGVTAGIIESATNDKTKAWAGSEAFLRALQTQGQATLLSSGSGITMHQQPLPIQVVTRTGYLAEVSKTVTESVGTTSELTAGSVTTGVAMSITPNILGDGTVVLQYSLSLSSLDSLEKIASGDQSIQTPEVSTRSFLQRVKVRVGSTLLLGGFEQYSQDHTDEKGIMAGLSSVKSERTMIVIAIDVQDASER